MKRLISKNVEFEYSPNAKGVDFIVPSLENLHLEVTSRQAESWDGSSEAMIRWKECLPVFKTGLSLLLIDATDTSQLSDSDWLEGFEDFESYTGEEKNQIHIGEIIQPKNRRGLVLAHLKVERIDNNSQKSTVVDSPLQSYGVNLSSVTQKLIQILSNKLHTKAQKSESNQCILCIDTTYCSYREAMPLSYFLPQFRTRVINALETELMNLTVQVQSLTKRIDKIEKSKDSKRTKRITPKKQSKTKR